MGGRLRTPINCAGSTGRVTLASPLEITQVRLSPDQRRIAARVFERIASSWPTSIAAAAGTRRSRRTAANLPVSGRDGCGLLRVGPERHTRGRRRADLGGAPELVYGPAGTLRLVLPRRNAVATLDSGGSTISGVPPGHGKSQCSWIGHSMPRWRPRGTALAYQAIGGGVWQLRALSARPAGDGRVGLTAAWSPGRFDAALLGVVAQPRSR